jgi:hypothetical protein
MVNQIGHIAFLNDLYFWSSIWNLNTLIQQRSVANVCSGPEAGASWSATSRASIKTQRNQQKRANSLSTFKLDDWFTVALLRIWLVHT